MLQQHRLAAGLSQEELAERAGLSRRGISDLERGLRQSPYPATIRRLGEALSLPDAERVALLEAARAGAQRGDSAPRAADRRTNIPAARLLLYGRAADVDLLAERVQSVPGRLVTITGPGGVGKTSIAVAVVRQVLPDFQDGAWLADLSTLATPGAVPQAVARAVGVRESQAATVDEALRAFLRDRQVLLLIDNCEHVVDACARLVDELLDQSAGLRILATSREPLHITGEVAHRLQPLPVPSHTPEGDPRSLVAYASVELFLDRARAVRPDLELTSRNAGTIAEICRRLDGIPLALELAATRVGGLTLDDIAERLRGSFAVLLGQSRSRPARHQTLRAALEWSHELLSPVEQAVFRRLGALAGGWTMAAAEAICSDADVDASEVADVLAGLVDKSLVVLDEHDGEARYRFLEPVREYAQGQLAASADSHATRDRHRVYFVAFAEQAEPELHRAEQAAWMRRLDRDLDNVRVAVRTGRARSDAESVLRVAGALTWYLWVRGHLREGLEWLDGLLEVPGVSDRSRMVGLGAAAMLLGALGRTTEATARATEQMALAERIGDVAEMARGATLLALEQFRGADLERTLPLFERALADARRAAHPMMLGNALVNLGQIVLELGNPGRAEALFRQGLAQFQDERDIWGIAYATNSLANLLRQRGEHEEAGRLSAEAVRLLTSLGDRFYLILAVEDLARARLDGRHGHSAVRLLGAADALRLASGALLSPFTRAENERAVARVRAALGEQAFEQAWADGTHHPFDVLTHETGLAVSQSAPARVDGLGGPGGVLTPREREVARLIGQGYSNRRIAEELVVTIGTAGVHVEHILRKLDLQSRHQVADWAMAQGLVPS
ncbi:MAG TPA: LuxR C-terminal-related transcriptional regulator [Chloroflexota bacterium]